MKFGLGADTKIIDGSGNDKAMLDTPRLPITLSFAWALVKKTLASAYGARNKNGCPFSTHI